MLPETLEPTFPPFALMTSFSSSLLNVEKVPDTTKVCPESLSPTGSVVRALETRYGVNPSRLIAAGRGETNPVADNATKEGRTKNRRTRIVLMPQLDQFYDLLAPSNMPK